MIHSRLSRLYLIKRVEELTYQVEGLRKENADLRVQISEMRADTDRLAEDDQHRLDAMKKRLTAANRENNYLLKTNLELSKKLNTKPTQTRLTHDKE